MGGSGGAAAGFWDLGWGDRGDWSNWGAGKSSAGGGAGEAGWREMGLGEQGEGWEGKQGDGLRSKEPGESGASLVPGQR